MKIALYFILFVGFMITVTVIDKLTSGPLVELGKEEKRDGAFIMSNEVVKYDSKRYLNKLTRESEVYKTKYSKSDKASYQKFTNESEIERVKVVKGEEDSQNTIVENKGIAEPRADVAESRTDLKESSKELIYEGDEYSVFSYVKGTVKYENKIWFDYMNPPSKKLKRKEYKNIWKKKGCCLWRNGEFYEVVLESNLFFKVGRKKIPVK
tara:strand:+ start:772 stop:1398 length:627 start_codon:yes stop_codon:yes gene_type:complete